MDVFDRLTSEKMTPYFLNLAKKGQKTESTRVIRSDTGIEFTDPKENHSHITGFYRNLYKKPVEQQDVNINDINRFLGNCRDVPEVENSKISDLEKK
jgi:hypothetical protein